jgi:hypothetical protein
MATTLKRSLQAAIIGGLSLISTSAQSHIIYGNAVLCSNYGWATQVAVSTDQFNAIVCKNNNNYYYVGQNKETNEQVLLPINESYATHNGMVYKAVNGRYTYQIFSTCEFNPNDNNWATLSVFDNGTKIRHDRTDHYMNNVHGCMNSSLVQVDDFYSPAVCGLFLERANRNLGVYLFGYPYGEAAQMNLNGQVQTLALLKGVNQDNNFQWSFTTQDNQTNVLVNLNSVEFLYGEAHMVEGFIKLTLNNKNVVIPVDGYYGC